MPKLRVHNFTMSLDGYVAGPDQSLDNPLGVGGTRLHEWMFATRMGRQMLGQDGGDEGLDNQFATQGDVGIGATIMGRNMFGPIRGPWGDGVDGLVGGHPAVPPSGVRAHPPPTSAHLDAGRNHVPLRRRRHRGGARARGDAADGNDVRVGGGAATIQQYLRAGLIDDLHLVIVPILLGGGERLFDHLDGGAVGYECVEFVSSPTVAHTRFSRTTT
jgi:dihydrofolate reductase